jgi:hypothetical protein
MLPAGEGKQEKKTACVDVVVWQGRTTNKKSISLTMSGLIADTDEKHPLTVSVYVRLLWIDWRCWWYINRISQLVLVCIPFSGKAKNFTCVFVSNNNYCVNVSHCVSPTERVGTVVGSYDEPKCMEEFIVYAVGRGREQTLHSFAEYVFEQVCVEVGDMRPTVSHTNIRRKRRKMTIPFESTRGWCRCVFVLSHVSCCYSPICRRSIGRQQQFAESVRCPP